MPRAQPRAARQLCRGLAAAGLVAAATVPWGSASSPPGAPPGASANTPRTALPANPPRVEGSLEGRAFREDSLLGKLERPFRAEAWDLLTSADRFFTPLAPFASAIVVTGAVLVSLVGYGFQSHSSWDPSAPWQTTSTSAEEVRVPAAWPGGSDELKRITTITRTTRLGAPMEDLTAATKTMVTNGDRAKLSARLLDELGAAEQPQRAELLSKLIWRSFFFHENEGIAATLQSGALQLERGDLQAAERSFLAAARMDPNYAEAWNRLATVHWFMGDYERSLSECDKVLELEPRHFGALSGRGLVLSDMARFEEAASAFREAQEVWPASQSLRNDEAFAEHQGTVPEFRQQ